MAKTTIQMLSDFGQSVWLDNISRSLVESSKLKEMIGLGLRGMTSNPTIFDNAISQSNDYDEKIAKLSNEGKSAFNIYDDLTVKDIQDASDILKRVYEKTNGYDGYVSLEVNPNLALNVKLTIEEAKRLHKKVNRDNVMFKVPATEAGFTAIEELLACGININVTLIFSVEQYIKTAKAYLNGLERLLDNGGNLKKVHSVASVFVSRVDTFVDKLLCECISSQQDKLLKDKLQSLKGKAAVANAKLIYKEYLKFSSSRFKELKDKGANLQRVLWGSTSTKNPNYSDIKYVTELIARDTVNTMPENTFLAFLDHGIAKVAFTSDTQEAQNIIFDLKNFRIDIDIICKRLLKDGLDAFEKSFNSLLKNIEIKAKKLYQRV